MGADEGAAAAALGSYDRPGAGRGCVGCGCLGRRRDGDDPPAHARPASEAAEAGGSGGGGSSSEREDEWAPLLQLAGAPHPLGSHTGGVGAGSSGSLLAPLPAFGEEEGARPATRTMPAHLEDAVGRRERAHPPAASPGYDVGSRGHERQLRRRRCGSCCQPTPSPGRLHASRRRGTAGICCSRGGCCILSWWSIELTGLWLFTVLGCAGTLTGLVFVVLEARADTSGHDVLPSAV